MEQEKYPIIALKDKERTTDMNTTLELENNFLRVLQEVSSDYSKFVKALAKKGRERMKEVREFSKRHSRLYDITGIRKGNVYSTLLYGGECFTGN